ncbi:MAG TPA: DUF456 domain-containing protein [Anaerolineae bacterium]|nr:DUF456 domain-containing protein [Anaerolineae bacterium]
MPLSFYTNPAANLAILLMLVGLVGAVVPVIPGPPLIWLGALAWAVGENFQRVNWITLAVLGIIALAATFAELWLTPLTQRQAGFGWKEILTAFAGGIAGGIFLSQVPIAGTLFGAAIGSVLAVSGLALWQRRSFGEAVRAGKTYLVGCALSSAVEVTLSLVMLAIFAWRAFFS